jgi:hypothetical protein
MAHSGNCASKSGSSGRTAAKAGVSLRARTANRLKDEVYRQMFLLESHRPGSEMALALALLRAVVQSNAPGNQRDLREWLKTICPIGLRMIDAALSENLDCGLHTRED